MKHFLSTRDYAVSQEGFDLWHDQDFDMLVTKPQPENMDSYYQSDSYISHTDASETFSEKLYQIIKRYNLRNKVRLINRFSHGEKTLLDIGAGTGDFLRSAATAGWEVTGIEPNKTARERAAEKGISLRSKWEEISIKRYQCITLWHVLEHLPNIEVEIPKILSLLEDDGTLVIAVPNFKSFDAQYYDRYWAAYDVPRHLYHFSQKSIKRLFGIHGWKVVTTKPMLFDAFYVALLSEKYKSGSTNYVKAFLAGFLSNVRAIWSKEHSSLIYCLKKN